MSLDKLGTGIKSSSAKYFSTRALPVQKLIAFQASYLKFRNEKCQDKYPNRGLD
jgi:hypothetical protein